MTHRAIPSPYFTPLRRRALVGFPSGTSENISPEMGASVGEPMFIGQYYDDAAALSYLNARYYDGHAGQFVAEDPILQGAPDVRLLTNPQALNYYSYSWNNPINRSDPSGLASSIAQTVQATLAKFNLSSFFNSFLSVFGSSGGSSGSGGSTPKGNGGSSAPSVMASYSGTVPTTNVLPNSVWRTQQPDQEACLSICKWMTGQGYAPSSYSPILTAGFSAGKLTTNASAGAGVDAINNALFNQKGILVGVNWGGLGGDGQSSYNVATEHYVVVRGYGTDNGQRYYTFLDPGTSSQSAGTSDSNRLYLNNNSLSGVSAYVPASGAQRTYVVTEVRPY